MVQNGLIVLWCYALWRSASSRISILVLRKKLSPGWFIQFHMYIYLCSTWRDSRVLICFTYRKCCVWACSAWYKGLLNMWFSKTNDLSLRKFLLSCRQADGVTILRSRVRLDRDCLYLFIFLDLCSLFTVCILVYIFFFTQSSLKVGNVFVI